jgi:hypothetical protein
MSAHALISLERSTDRTGDASCGDVLIRIILSCQWFMVFRFPGCYIVVCFTFALSGGLAKVLPQQLLPRYGGCVTSVSLEVTVA